ncbi:MAG: PASTA domain-containing protein [Termitinemataceae bacterium]|nr:MAG: PASTA domain-containing protein [Termitinemataceae bacterium]
MKQKLNKIKEFAENGEQIVLQRPKFFFWICASVVLIVGITSIIAFFISVRGPDETMVPDLREKQLVEALIELQQKELYPRIQLRYSKSADEKNTILEQEPRPGTIVKAGRRIRLVVSQGVMVSVVDNYVNRNIDEVRLDLQTLNANNPQPILSFKEPFLYQFSSKPAGIILEQSPPPGTGIATSARLEFVISKGARREFSQMPDLVGLKLADAMPLIEDSGIRWTFDYTLDSSYPRGGVIVLQDIDADSSVAPDKVACLTVAEDSKLDDDEVFGIFKYTLNENPYPLLTKLEEVTVDNMRRVIVEVHHSGNEFSYPYSAKVGSTLVLSLLDREMYKEEVRAR